MLSRCCCCCSSRCQESAQEAAMEAAAAAAAGSCCCCCPAHSPGSQLSGLACNLPCCSTHAAAVSSYQLDAMLRHGACTIQLVAAVSMHWAVGSFPAMPGMHTSTRVCAHYCQLVTPCARMCRFGNQRRERRPVITTSTRAMHSVTVQSHAANSSCSHTERRAHWIGVTVFTKLVTMPW